MTARKFQVVQDGATLRGRQWGEGAQSIVFLNGAFGTWRDWRPVVRQLGEGYRAVLYDMRGRGSSTSADDYSFAACERDLEVVLASVECDQPILVGWSYGAALAVRYAAKHPDAVKGIVLVDGAFPHSTFVTEEDKEKVRQMWHGMRWLLPVLSLVGKAGKMSAEQHAAINLELDELLGSFAGEFAKVTCPVRFVVASKPSVGGTKEQFEALRASTRPLIKKYSNITEFAELPCTHLEIIPKHADTIVKACTTL